MVLDEETESKQKKEKDRFPKKIVVRKLPRTFTEEEFLTSVQPLGDHNYFSFVEADKSLGVHAFSRAYINFINQEDVFTFRDQFDGYVFVDQKGNEFPAIVEYAPFPKIPKLTKQRPDPRSGTIDDDEDYLAFLESLKDQSNSDATQIEAMLEEIEKEERLLKAAIGTKTKTPLLEYVEQRASDRHKMIERRRKRDFERKKVREEERKKRKEIVKKREVYKDEREKLRQKREHRERPKKEVETGRNRQDETTGKETKYGESSERKYEKTPLKYSSKTIESTQIKTKRYSEVRKREEKEKRCHIVTNDAKRDLDSDSKCDKKEKGGTEEGSPEEIVRKELPVEDQLLTEENIGEREVSSDGQKDSSKYSRSEIRIRNKDRPALQLYRPGQSRLKSSTKTTDGKTVSGSSSSSTSPTQVFSQEEEDDSTPGSRAEANPPLDFGGQRDNTTDKQYEEKSFRGSRGGRKGYSYLQDRESRKRLQSKCKEEVSQFKSKAYRRPSED